MEKRLQILINTLLMAIISALGFASCKREVDEYGCPHTDYVAEGYVLDDEDNKPIDGVEISWLGTAFHKKAEPVPTDENGRYETETTLTGGYYGLVARDPLGRYERDTIRTPEKVQIEKGKKWYKGKFKINHTFHLKKSE